MKLRFSFLILLVCFLAAVPSFAQGYVDFLPEEVKNPFKEKWDRIGADTPGSGDEWEGEYSRDIGATYMHLLRWNKQDGFAALQDTCSNGPRVWVNTGEVSVTPDGSVMFIPARNDAGKFTLKTPLGEYRRVKWGEQHWLIPKSGLRRFIYAVISGSSADLDDYYVRIADKEKARTGLPDLPKEMMSLFKMAPIEVAVVGVGDGEYPWERQITIDAGAEKDVVEGMTFFLVGEKNVMVTATVSEVSKNTSVLRLGEVAFSYEFNDDTDHSFEPKPGLKFSSRMPDSYTDQIAH